MPIGSHFIPRGHLPRSGSLRPRCPAEASTAGLNQYLCHCCGLSSVRIRPVIVIAANGVFIKENPCTCPSRCLPLIGGELANNFSLLLKSLHRRSTVSPPSVAAARRPSCHPPFIVPVMCHPSIVTVTCQLATHAAHARPAVHGYPRPPTATEPPPFWKYIRYCRR